MAEEINLSGVTRREKYQSLLPQLIALTEAEPDQMANLGNIIAALKQFLGFFWIGIYFVKGNDLVLGSFQGPIACTRIAFGKGVCGKSWKEKKAVVVPDVDEFPGHIACSILSKSEIVLPGFDKQGEVILVLDVDSDKRNDFDQVDVECLQSIVQLIEGIVNRE